MFLFLLVTVTSLSFKLWSPRTIGMRLLGLVYVSNFDFLPVNKENAIMLYTSREKYNNEFNKKQLGEYLSENTAYGVTLKITPLHTKYNQSRIMMINGVYLAKKKVYCVFKEDYIDSGKIDAYLHKQSKGMYLGYYIEFIDLVQFVVDLFLYLIFIY